MLQSTEVMIVKVSFDHANLEKTHNCFIQELCKSTQNKMNVTSEEYPY